MENEKSPEQLAAISDELNKISEMHGISIDELVNIAQSLRKDQPQQVEAKTENIPIADDAIAQRELEDVIAYVDGTDERKNWAREYHGDDNTRLLIGKIRSLSEQQWKGATTSRGVIVPPYDILDGIESLKKIADKIPGDQILMNDGKDARDHLAGLAAKMGITGNLRLRETAVKSIMADEYLRAALEEAKRNETKQ